MTAPLEPAELEDLRGRLRGQLETVVGSLLGEPVVRTRLEWRYGTGNGSLAIVMAGRKRGLWNDRALIGSGKSGGDLLALMRQTTGCTFAEAVDRACALVGYDPPSRNAHLSAEQRHERVAVLEQDRVKLAAERATREAKAEAERQAEDAKAIAAARALWDARAPLEGSSAFQYLTVTRGIPAPLCGFPASIAWHPAARVLIAAATNVAGDVTAVQIVRLAPDGRKRLGAALVKQTTGRLSTSAGQAVVRLPASPGADPALLLHAEGIETGLSAWAAHGWETWVALGSGFNPQPGRLNVVLADDDPPDSPRGRALAQQVGSWREASLRFAIARPWEIPRNDKSDFNDLIRAAGPGAVRDRVYAALLEVQQPTPVRGARPTRHLAGEIEQARRGVTTTLPAYYPAPTEARAPALERQVTVIRDTINAGAARAAARHEAWRRRNAEIADLGLPGLNLTPAAKATITRRQHHAVAAEAGFGNRIPLAPRVLTTGAQATGKTAAAIEAIAGISQTVNVWFTEPTLEKAEEVARDYAKATRNRPDALPGLVVRGRGQTDPARGGHTMCDRAEIARRVAEAGLSVRKTLCPTCPFLGSCGTRRQAARIEAIPHGVYFLASAYLFLPSPAPTPDILIIDEQATIAAVDTAEIAVTALDPYMIRGLGIDTRETLNTLRLVLSSGEPALRALRAARIDKAELTAVLRSLDGVLLHATADIAGEMDDTTIADMLDASERWAILDTRKVVAAVRREIDMPRDGLNGVSADRKTITVSRLRNPRGVKRAAVIAMDGTGDETLNRQLFGSTLRHERIAIERDAYVTGTIGKRYARQSMTGIDAKGKPIASKAASSTRLRAEIGDIARAMPGRCAVFSNQTTIDILIEDDALDEHAPVGHFNKLRGLNEWQNCRSALVPGQNSMRIGDLETLARAYMVTDPVPFVSMDGPLAPGDAWECQQWPFIVTRMRRMRDGSLSPVVVPVHPDPRCQRVLEQVREAECVQAADRVRPIFNRRDLTFMSNLCLDVTYDVIRTHRELVAGGNPLERAFAMTGLLPLNAADLYRAHPGRFVSERAAARALENYPPIAKRGLLCDGGVVSYRTDGQRGSASKALVDLGWHRDPLVTLRQALGPITEFQGDKLAVAPLVSQFSVRPFGGMPAEGRWPAPTPFSRPLTHAPPRD
jgi:phage/plasmid primase-like uncharacterized protein